MVNFLGSAVGVPRLRGLRLSITRGRMEHRLNSFRGICGNGYGKLKEGKEPIITGRRAALGPSKGAMPYATPHRAEGDPIPYEKSVLSMGKLSHGFKLKPRSEKGLEKRPSFGSRTLGYETMDSPGFWGLPDFYLRCRINDKAQAMRSFSVSLSRLASSKRS